MGFRIITFCLAVFGMLDAGQTGYQWDANGSGPGLGGSGSWSEGGLNWDLLGTGSDDGSDPCVAPAFGVAVQAVFAGTGGMVTLDSGLQPTLIGLKLASAGYELTGGPGTMIQLAGDDPWIETEDDASITAILSSPNRWTKRGPSTLLLTGTNTFPNGLLIREGSLLVRNAAALGSGPIQIGNASSDTGNTSLVLDAHPTFVSNPVTIAHSGPGVATLRSTTQGGGFDAVNGFSQVILQADAVIDSNALGSSVISSLSGSGNLTVAGTGKTILPGPNTFSGNVTVSTGPGGSLQIGSGSGSPNVLPDDSILHVQADSIVRMEYGAGGNETIGAVTGGGTIWLPSVTSPPGKSLTVGGGDKSGSFQGRLTAPSPGLQRLIKIGNGTQSLTGTNSDFSGGVRIFGGVLEVAYIGSRSLPSSIGRPATGADGLVIDGGTFRHIGPDSVTDRGFTIGPLGAAIEASGTGKLDFQGYTGTGDAIVLSDTFTPRTLTLGGISSADNRINLVIPDKGTGSTAAATTVVKTGPGTWILSANNSFTGQLRILDGTLSIPRTTDYGSSQPMGIGAASSTKLVLDGGCLAMTAATNQAWSMGFQVGQNGGCINVSQPNVNFVWNSNRTAFHLDGTLEKRGPGLLRLSSTSSVAHTATAETDLVVHEGIVQFTGSVSGSPFGLRAFQVEVKSSGSLRLSSNNTLGGNSTGTTGSWGSIQLDGGTLEVNGSHFLPPATTDAPPAMILAAGQVTGSQILSATTSGAFITSLPSSSSSIIGNSGLSTAFGPITFDIADGDAPADLVITAPITGTNQGGVIKSGSGTLSLVGTNSYAGSTRVDSGTLELATSGTLRFIRSATGAFNRVHGGGSAVFRGSFDIVTDTTNLVPGSRWRLVETATATYSEEFSIPGFTRQGTIHTRDASGLVWSFDEGSGELSVTFAQIPPDFASWANLISDTSLRGAQDDPDGDGLTNLSEYLFGSMPHIPSGAVILSEYDVAHLVLRWNQIQSGASYQLQQGRLGEDFKWEPSPEPVAPDPVQTQVPPGWTRMRAVIPVGHNQQFFRVQAAIP